MLLSVLGGKGWFLPPAMLAGCISLVMLFRYSRIFLGLAIILLGIAPCSWGVDVGGLPKLFADELLFLIYAGYFGLEYFILKNKRFRAGDLTTSRLLIALLCILSLSFVGNETNYTAVRNYIETYIFGFMLYFIFFNEAEDKNINLIINAIVITAALLSIGMFLEWGFRYNPVMKSSLDFLYLPAEMTRNTGTLYLSPEMSRAAGAVYRPYATFFHPSEGGLYIAMCLPFVYHKFKESERVAKGVVLIIMLTVITAVSINYTRGVWLALVVSILIYIYQIRPSLLALIIFLIVFMIIAVYSLQDLLFDRRLIDPQNLFNRFFYWHLALKIFCKNIFLGIGHMNFKEVYMSFVSTIPLGNPLDPRHISVVDSIYLTTLAEFGVFGLTALLAFWIGALTRLKRLCRWLKNIGDKAGSNLSLLCLQSITIYLLAGFMADVHQFGKATKLAFIILGLGFSTMKQARQLHTAGKKIIETTCESDEGNRP